MIVDFIYELEVYGVFDRGVPNKERIAILAKQPVNIGQHGVMIGIRENSGRALPIKDNLFWFGDAQLNAGDWLFIYTGDGKPSVSELPNSISRIFSIHWGRPKTVFDARELVPILFRVDAVFIPQDQPALSSQSGQ